MISRAIFIAAGVALALALAAGSSAAGAIGDPSCGEMRIVMQTSTVVYSLPHGFIRAGSDSLRWRDRLWRRSVDYTLDELRGQLRLLREPVPGDTLRLEACWLLEAPPLELQLMRYHAASENPSDSASGEASADSAGPRNPIHPGLGRDPSTAPTGTSLTLRGNKTLAVEFGSNQDAFLRQSLDLAVSGTLAPGVELTGVLSDRNTPLTSGGSTQSLEALDRVLIELKAPHGNAALGDLDLDLHQGEFARLNRRLQGARGEWSAGSFRASVAAANAPGEYHRLQLIGIEGRQGPYLLTDREGNLGIAVVANSEIVTVDGERMTRGEGADYSMDYERARITFTNRRPISSATRITVDYQYTLNRYRRNLIAAGGRWEGKRGFAYVQGLSEGDDRGRPINLAFDANDRLVLEAVGDSAGRAISGGVVAGGGDYDTVRVSPTTVVFAFTGRDSGEFSVEFARVGDGSGEYADSSVVSGQTAFRFVGAGQGAYRVGRAIPLPETHRLWSIGGGAHLGSVTTEVEGALSRMDRNSASSLDDGDNDGHAGRAEIRWEGNAPGRLGSAGLALRGRVVGERFVPFTPLERPFAQEDWGLPVGADLDHQSTVALSGFIRPKRVGEIRAEVGALRTLGGFSSRRSEVGWSREGTLSTRAIFQRADGIEDGRRFADGGRERLRVEARVRTRWLEPMLHAESDERRSPSDTGRVGNRFREGGLDLGTGRDVSWRVVAGYAIRRDASAGPVGFVDQSETRIARFTADSPPQSRLGVALSYQRRDLEPIAGTLRTRSDLASVRLRSEQPFHGMTGRINLEITSEGENRRTKQLTFVGAGRGAYDALGNLVGVGDYDLVVSVTTDLDRVARASTSAGLVWQFTGASETWRGSRVGFDFESEARRHGEVALRDPFVPPGSVLTDADLAGGSVLQRIETEVAPASRAGAVRVRAERRVSADRSFANFAQTQDDRTLSARWRAHPTTVWGTEAEAHFQKHTAGQSLGGGGAFHRVLLEEGGVVQLIFTPGAGVRAVGVLDGSWSRPEDRDDLTRTLRVGPDLGLAIGARGHLETSVRRAFESGAPAVALFPSATPADAPRWDGSTRFDYRVRETVTLGLSFTGRDRPGRPAEVTGRAEMRAFF